MYGSTSRNLHLRAALVCACIAAIAVSMCFTSAGQAASGNGGRVRVALQHYDLEHFIAGGNYGSVEAGQSVEFATSIGSVKLFGIGLEPPENPLGQITLPALGTPPVQQTVLQRVTAELALGPGSEPFTIDSFFDITYRITNLGAPDMGLYEVELLAMNLSGMSPYGIVAIQTNPLYESKGLETVNPLAGTGTSLRTSFFDIFTEISIGGGPFVPANAEFRVGYVPEPGTIVLAMLGVAGVGLTRRRGRG